MLKTKRWNDWKIEDGDYIAEHNEPLKSTLFANGKITLSIVVAIFSIALFALVLI